MICTLSPPIVFFVYLWRNEEAYVWQVLGQNRIAVAGARKRNRSAGVAEIHRAPKVSRNPALSVLASQTIPRGE